MGWHGLLVEFTERQAMRIIRRFLLSWVVVGLVLIAGAAECRGQQQGASSGEVEELRQTVRELAARVSALETELKQKQAIAPAQTTDAPNVVAAKATTTNPETEPRSVAAEQVAAERVAVERASVESVPAAGVVVKSDSPAVVAQSAGQPVQAGKANDDVAKSVVEKIPAQLPGGATVNYYFDGYYGFDFNHPIGRVQYLRAYDVLSNAFSINQAGLVLALDPAPEEGRRFGARLDLQFGQATDTLQGNPANEPRPEIYRNIFQAYGTYVFPVSKGLTVDVGKWASSIGIEGNYTKDQMNYSRSFYFNYLPFYHMGVRANYKLTDKVAVNYWLVNGTNQTEPTNSYKDELFGLALQPRKDLSWTVNYYVGQDHPDAVQNPNGCGTVPVQPQLCLEQVNPAPDGKQHIFDSYATWSATPKLTLALEGDYVISRLWRNSAPGESSAPSHVLGGAGYARYQMSKRMALAGRTEYLSDRGGLFSGTTQSLKEFTGTYEFKVAEGLMSRVEYRRDWTNKPFFLTNKPGVLSQNQDTLTVGLVWWYGGKTGAW